MSARQKSSDKTVPLLADDDDGSTGLIAAANVQDAPEATPAADSKTKSLIISFVLMVVIGLGNKIFQARARCSLRAGLTHA